MTPGDLDELRELLHPLIRDLEADPYPDITTTTLARRKENRR